MARAGPNGVILPFLGQYPWAPGVTLEDGPAQGQELDWITLVGPFQLSLFCHSVIFFPGLHEAE